MKQEDLQHLHEVNNVSEEEQALRQFAQLEREYEDAMAAIYEESYYGYYLQRRYMRDFASLIARWLPRRARILDVGCGTGLLLAELQRRGFRNLIGVDLSPRMIEKARQNFNGPLQIADIYQLPFENESFDAVIVSSVLHHLPDVPRALKEIDRILQCYGLLFVREPHQNRYFAVNVQTAGVGVLWLMHSLHRAEGTVIPKEPPATEFHRAFTQDELRQAINSVFDILVWENRYPLSPFFSRVKLSLIQRLALWGDKLLSSLDGSEFFVVASKKYYAPSPKAVKEQLAKTIAALRPQFGWKVALLFHTMRIVSRIYSRALQFFRGLR